MLVLTAQGEHFNAPLAHDSFVTATLPPVDENTQFLFSTPQMGFAAQADVSLCDVGSYLFAR